MTPVRRYDGWRYSPPTEADWKASALLSGAAAPPERASLRTRAGTSAHVLDQQRNDCVAHAVARAVQVALTRSGGELAPLPSRDWIYYLSGVPSLDQTNDDGRFIRDAFAACSRTGWPDEAVWPYGQWPTHPGGAAFRGAFDRRAGDGIAYHRVSDGAARKLQMQQAIASGYPVVIGTLVTPSFEEQDGVDPLPFPLPGAQILGGHAIALLEYDADGVGFCNSWGAGWAAGGWGRLSWEWVLSNYVSDCWAVQIVPGAAS
jgi:hypothetical protein